MAFLAILKNALQNSGTGLIDNEGRKANEFCRAII
jgi:hypothetical protein